MTSVTTVERLAAALEVKLVVGFGTEAGDRELVTVKPARRIGVSWDRDSVDN